MAKPQDGSGVVLSPAAQQDLRDILLWSLDRFGINAANRYRALLIQALNDIAADPLRPGSRARPELAQGARTYHLFFSRSSVKEERVKEPRHFILYRCTPARLEVARILHDNRDLGRHVPTPYRS